MIEPTDEDRFIAYVGIVMALKQLESHAKTRPPPCKECSVDAMVAIFAEVRGRFQKLVGKYDRKIDTKFMKTRGELA